MTPGSGVKLKVYYWPNANGGAGHIACNLQEVGGKGRSLFVTPGFMQGMSSRKERVEKLKEQLQVGDSKEGSDVDKNLKNVSQYLPIEMQAYNSSPVIQIELPLKESKTFDDVINEFSELAKKNLQGDYNVLLRNCAHLTAKMIAAVHGSDFLKFGSIDKFGLLPKTVARVACDIVHPEGRQVPSKEAMFNLLNCQDDDSYDDHPNVEILAKLSKGGEDNSIKSISKISQYEMAKGMLLGVASTLSDKKFNSVKGFEVGAKIKNFVDSFSDKKVTCDKVTEEFKSISNGLKAMEKQLKGTGLVGLLTTARLFFYEAARLVIKDPKLERLRALETTIAQVTGKGDVFKDKIKDYKFEEEKDKKSFKI